jgi:predicted amidophosphoribosyltransferase
MAAFADLLDLVFPRRCVTCGNPSESFCRSCSRSGEILRRQVRGFPVAAAGFYRDELRTAILSYKERNRRDLVIPLGALLVTALDALDPVSQAQPRRVLVPVPSARAVARTRGGDHVRRLGRAAARMTRLELRPALTLTRAVHDSAGLDSIERARNVAHAMVAQAPLGEGCAAVLVDDIVTTGATLSEAARALTAAGWPVHGAAVIASTAQGGGAILRASPAPALAASRYQR